MRTLFNLLLLAGLSGLAGAVWVAHRQPDMTQVDGLAPPRADTKARDLLDDLRQAGIKRNALVEVSEADLNRHLAATLGGDFPEPIHQVAQFEKLAVDLEADRARLFFIWNLAGHRSALTVDLAILREEKHFKVEVLGGSYGRLKVPRGLLRPLAPFFNSVAKTLDPDIKALFQMNHIRLVKDKLVLDPRFL